jgi:hypothetical protein
MLHRILLTNEVAESTGSTDPLAQAAGGWEGRKFPLLQPDRIINFKLFSCKKVALKSDTSRSQLEIVMATEEDQVGKEGENLRKGFKVYHYIGIDPTPPKAEGKKGRTIDMVFGDLSEVLQWCGLKSKTPRELVNNPSIVEGYVGQCRTRVIEDPTGTYDPKNGIRFVLPS